MRKEQANQAIFYHMVVVKFVVLLPLGFESVKQKEHQQKNKSKKHGMT